MRKRTTSFRLDRETREALQKLALPFEGNASLALRQLIRQAAQAQAPTTSREAMA